MVARVAHEDPDGITQEEKQIVEDFVGLDWQTIGESYSPYTSDPVTGELAHPRDEKVSLAKFMGVWLSIGLKHPKTYINAFFAQTSGWVSFVRPASRTADNTKYVSNTFVEESYYFSTRVNKGTFGTLIDGETENNRSTVITGKRQQFLRNLLKWLYSIPVLNVLSYATPWVILPFFLLYVVWQRRRTIAAKQALMALLPLVVSILTLCLYALSGSDYIHYMFHAVALGPIYLLCAFGKWKA